MKNATKKPNKPIEKDKKEKVTDEQTQTQQPKQGVTQYFTINGKEPEQAYSFTSTRRFKAALICGGIGLFFTLWLIRILLNI